MEVQLQNSNLAFNLQIVSIVLNRDPKPEVGGEIVFRGADWRHFGGDNTFVPIAQSGYWQGSSLFTRRAKASKAYEVLGTENGEWPSFIFLLLKKLVWNEAFPELA